MVLSSPKTSSQQTDWRPRGTHNIVSVQVLRQKTNVPNQKQPGRDSKFSLALSCSIQFSSGSDEAHPHRGGQSALLSLQSQMLISPRNTLKDTPQILFNQISGQPRPSQVDTKLNITESVLQN